MGSWSQSLRRFRGPRWQYTVYITALCGNLPDPMVSPPVEWVGGGGGSSSGHNNGSRNASSCTSGSVSNSTSTTSSRSTSKGRSRSTYK